MRCLPCWKVAVYWAMSGYRLYGETSVQGYRTRHALHQARIDAGLPWVEAAGIIPVQEALTRHGWPHVE